MKKILFIVALSILAACNDAGDVKLKMVMSDLALEKISGEIDSIEEEPYKTDSTGKIGEMDTCCFMIWDYDTNGNAQSFASRKIGGSINEESRYVRYENGLWKSSKSWKDGKRSGSVETKVDKNGRYTDAIEYDTAGKVAAYYTNITQNENGQVLSWKQYDKDSIFRTEGVNTYDSLFLQTAFTLKDSVGNIKSTTLFKYNEKGEQIEETKSEKAKDIAITTPTISRYTYATHDEKGNWTQRTTRDDKGRATKIVKRIYIYR